jgi:hypothetical protein
MGMAQESQPDLEVYRSVARCDEIGSRPWGIESVYSSAGHLIPASRI